MDQDRVLQAVSLFGARLRGQGSDFDTPALRAWLRAEADTTVDAAVDVDPGARPAARRAARRVLHRLPAPAQDRARRAVRALRARRVGA